MNPKTIGVVSTLLILLLIGGIMLWEGRFKTDSTGEQSIVLEVSKAKKEEEKPTRSSVDELDILAKRVASDIHTEFRLNLNMMAQLRAYQDMLKQVQGYAKNVERDIDIIKEISKGEYQEDVSLQASLFTGKRPEMVAKHLEAFRASRVGAILAKMKEKEASAVMDIWAKNGDRRISEFYRQVMASFLNNRRRDAHPELFNKLTESTADNTEDATQNTSG